jgi:hypothetical protein
MSAKIVNRNLMPSGVSIGGTPERFPRGHGSACGQTAPFDAAQCILREEVRKLRPQDNYRNPDEFSTTSFQVASYIYAQQVPLIGITFRGRSPIFWFEGKDGCARRLCDDYHDDKSAPAKSLFTALSRLKDEVRRATARPADAASSTNGEVRPANRGNE